MKFKLKRQIIDKYLLDFCSKRIKKDKIDISLANKQIIKGLPPILEEIEARGLPSYLRIKKLKKNLGSGIFLNPDAKAIPKGAPIAPYSGIVTLSPQNSESDSNYIFCLISDLRLSKEEQKKWDPTQRYHPRRLYSVDLDAEKQGNFTRFINHSSKPNIEARFVRIPKNSVGLAPSPFEIIYVAKKKILPGEQLLVCYEGEDKSYWGPLKIKPFPMTPKTFILTRSQKIKSS